MENIDRKHVLRNKLIANYLYDIYSPRSPPKLGGQGGGHGHHQACPEPAEGMRRLMREHGLAEPVFEDLGSFFAVTFYGPGERILDLIPEEGVVDLRELGLNERQIEALRLMVNEGREMTNALYQEMFGVSRNTASRDLARLVDTGWVRRLGARRGSRYVAE